MHVTQEKQNKIVKLGTWNVKNINGREEEIIKEMKRYNIDCMGVTETKKTDMVGHKQGYMGKKSGINSK